MIDTTFIENIVKEVIVKLEMERDFTKPNLLVIPKPGLHFAQEISQLKKEWQIVEANQVEGESYSAINQAVFLNLDQDTLVRAALGLTDTVNSQRFAQLISNEIPITIVLDEQLQRLLLKDDGTHYYSFYIKKLRSYKETIETFGVSFKTLEEFLKQKKESINKSQPQKH